MILIHMHIYKVSEKSLNGRITPETHITLKTGNIYVKYFFKRFSEVSIFIPSTDPMGRGGAEEDLTLKSRMITLILYCSFRFHGQKYLTLVFNFFF